MVKPGAGARLPCKPFTFYLDLPAEKAKYTLAFDALLQAEGALEKKQPSWKFSVDGVKEGVLVTAPSPTEGFHETPTTKGKRFEKFFESFS